jgi:hypothetical protein
MKITEALEIILRQVEHDLTVDHIGKVEKLREAFDTFKANQDLRAEIEDYLAPNEGFPIGNDAEFGTNME